MNNSLIIGAALLMMSACSEEERCNLQPNDNTPTALGIAGVRATSLQPLGEEYMDGSSQPTRSTLDEGSFDSWTVGDAISISDGTLMYRYQVSQTYGRECSFTVMDGSSPFTGAEADGKTFYASYPDAAVKGWNGSVVTMQVYAGQDHAANQDGGTMGAYMVTEAVAEEGGEHVSFGFTHTASVLEVNLSGLGITPKAVSLRSNSGVAIAGQVKCDAHTRKLTLVTNDKTGYAANSQSDVIRLDNMTAGATVARFYLLPVQLKGGVTVTVEDTNGQFYTKSTTTDIGNTTSDFTITGGGAACTPYYKKVNFGSADGARKGCWMATLPGSIYFSLLSTPGSPDSATSGCTSSTSLAKCQSDDIQTQLENGVRIFDLRPGYMGKEALTASNLYIYHGQISTNVLYTDAIKTLVDFLKANPTEAITIVQVKENNKPTLGGSGYSDRSSEMWSVINACQNQYASYFLNVDRSANKLSDLRGKILFINRNATATARGFMITNWPDNGIVTDYSARIAGTCYANIEDAYNDKQDQKKEHVSQMLDLASANTNYARYHFTYTSIAGALLGTSLAAHAKVMNPYTAAYIKDSVTGPVGYVLGDYMGSTTNGGQEILQAIIQQNYKYCF